MSRPEWIKGHVARANKGMVPMAVRGADVASFELWPTFVRLHLRGGQTVDMDAPESTVMQALLGAECGDMKERR